MSKWLHYERSELTFLFTAAELFEEVSCDAGMIVRKVNLTVNDKELETFLLGSQLGLNFF
jgi:hypothetical protein